MENGKMKIGIFVDSFYPNIDGVSQVVNNYCTCLSRYDDVDVTLVTPRYKEGHYERYPFRVYPYLSFGGPGKVGYRVGWPFVPKIVRDVRAMDFDLVHIHCPLCSSELQRLTNKDGHAKTVLTYHTKYDVDFEARLRLAPMKKIAYSFLKANVNYPDEVWIVSQGSEEALRRIGFTGTCRVMENGVDLPRGRASDADCDALRREYSLPDGVPVFTFIGRMQWYKNIRLLLDGLKLVKEAGLNFRFLMVGDGQDLNEMKAYVRQIGLADRVIFTGSVREREKLRVFYSITDLFLFLSTFDTAAIVVKEAAASDVPVLFAAGSDSAYGVEEGVNGWFAEENPRAVADKILLAAGDRDNLRRVGQRAGDTLYVPWSVSVDRAYRRYKEILRGE
ncbi:MAG: glycosyltransferase [Clostridia bacterium]|nr:glycosyltransferase [Clostridia bacterium]